MRLSALPILLAGASILGLVAAEPIRVTENPSNANIRFGLALANANVNGNDDDVARIVRPVVLMNPPVQVKSKLHHSCGDSLREKAIRLSNTLRHAFGMPLIGAHVEVPRPARISIHPAGYPSHNVVINSQEEFEEEKGGKHHPDGEGGEGDEHHRHHKHHGHYHRHHHKHHKNFLRRIHRAIKTLGPWEGRAVAFVLGCGVGVLLRMFWVLTVLVYRTVRGEREESFDREYIVYEQVPETLFVAPPQYTDEKVREEAAEETEEHK